MNEMAKKTTPIMMFGFNIRFNQALSLINDSEKLFWANSPLLSKIRLMQLAMMDRTREK